MKQRNRILLLVAATAIVLILGGLVVIRQIGMRPYVEPIPPISSPSPTPQINPDITVTIQPDIALLSQALGNVLQETASADERTETPLVPTTASTDPTVTTPCAFSWAHQDLPELTQAARNALSTISIAQIQVLQAEAYGESCGRSFSAITTDFYLSVDVTDLTDQTHLAQIVKTAYTVLTELKVTLPAQAGYLDITFAAGGQSKHFRAMFQQVKPVIEAGKESTDLLALGGL